MTGSEFARDLRALADWCTEHADVPMPSGVTFNVFLTTKEELAHIARILSPCAKGGDDTWFWLSRRFGFIRLEFNLPRTVACTRRVVGTEEMPAVIRPAYTREIMEWHCDPILEPSENTS